MVYLRIHDLIKNGIHAGLYPQGDNLPSEVELAKQFNVSRTTLRKALKILQDDGLVECRHGAGNFVSSKRIQINILHDLKGFSEIVKDAEIDAKSKILKFEIQNASPVVANSLGLKFKDEVYFFSRLRYLNSLPVELENSWISTEKFRDLTLEYLNGSLYDYFENNCHISISGTCLHYSSLIPSAEIAALLKIRENTPVIKVQSQLIDIMNFPFLYSENFTNCMEYPIRMFVKRRNVESPHATASPC